MAGGIHLFREKLVFAKLVSANISKFYMFLVFEHEEGEGLRRPSLIFSYNLYIFQLLYIIKYCFY